MNDVVSAALSLNASEKLHLIEVLWDDLSATPDELPLPAWQREDLDRRRAYLKEHPESALTWEQIVDGIKSRHGG